MMAPLTCDQARQALFPDPAAVTAGPALEHYRSCPACQAFFVWQRRMVDRLSRLEPPAASAVLRARLRLALSGSVRRGRRGRLWTITAAAAGLLLSWMALRPADPTAPFAPAARHLAAMPMGDTADRLAAATRLSQQLRMPLELPEIEGADFMGADLVSVRGTMWAGARYRFKGITVAYFALPMDDMEPDTGMTAGSSGEWQVAMWQEEGGIRAVAGARPLSRDDVLALASECRAKAAMLRTSGS